MDPNESPPASFPLPIHHRYVRTDPSDLPLQFSQSHGESLQVPDIGPIGLPRRYSGFLGIAHDLFCAEQRPNVQLPEGSRPDCRLCLLLRQQGVSISISIWLLDPRPGGRIGCERPSSSRDHGFFSPKPSNIKSSARIFGRAHGRKWHRSGIHGKLCDVSSSSRVGCRIPHAGASRGYG